MRIIAAATLTMLLSIGPLAAQTFGVASFFAQVSRRGETVLSSGVQASERTARGKYRVTFTRPITSCAYVASPLGGTGGQASVVRQGNRHVIVSTFSSAGTATNLSFNLIVFCAP